LRHEILELLKDKKALKEKGLFIVDTEKILGEAVGAGFEIAHLLYTEHALPVVDKYMDRLNDGIYETTKASFVDRFANVKTHQGFIAVVRSVNREIKGFSGINAMVLLDTLQDPANVGAIIRSGAAFGFNNFLLKDSANIYGDKAIRASAGAAFRVNYKNVELNELEGLRTDFTFVAADVKNGIDLRRAKGAIKGKYIITLGSEGQGISEEVKKLCDLKININYSGTVESLNVAAAAAIIFYEMAV
jgi:TrmH family RNA methyltransferase